MIQYRKSLSTKEKNPLFDKILAKFFKLPEYINATTILAYYGLESTGEFNTLPLLHRILLDNKHLYLPRCVQNKIKLEIFEITDLRKELEIGAYNIREPIPNPNSFLSKSNLNLIDLIIIPGLIFDNYGNRYGYGKGYYDSLLEKYNGIKVAFALDKAISDIPLKIHSNDVPISIIITPSKKICI